MIALLVGTIICVALAFVLLIRVVIGPTAIDRLCAGDAMDLIVSVGLVLYSLYTGRAIYLDIALVTALFGFIGAVFVSRYLEGRV